MKPQEFKNIREALDLTQHGTARLFRMGKHGGRNVQHWEAGNAEVPGWASLVMDILNSGKLPDLTPFKRQKPGRPRKET